METFCYLPSPSRRIKEQQFIKLPSGSLYLAYNTDVTCILFTKLFQHILHLSSKLSPSRFNTANIRACQQRWFWAITTHFILPQFYFQNINPNVILSSLSVLQVCMSSFITNKTEISVWKVRYCTVISENSTYYDVRIKTEMSAGNHLPVNPVSHHRRHKSSFTMLWEPQIMHVTSCNNGNAAICSQNKKRSNV